MVAEGKLNEGMILAGANTLGAVVVLVAEKLKPEVSKPAVVVELVVEGIPEKTKVEGAVAVLAEKLKSSRLD